MQLVKVFLRRKSFLPILLIVALGYVVASFFPSAKVPTTQALALQLSSACRVRLDRAGCLRQEISRYTNRLPDQAGKVLAGFWELEKQGKLGDDPRVFSDISHFVGMDLIDRKIPLPSALAFCGTSFKQGCIHGAVMEYIDIQYPTQVEAPDLFLLCQNVSGNKDSIYRNCLHGVGHALAAKILQPLQEVLHLCDRLPLQERTACTSGIVMEYSKGTAGSGAHSHEPIGKKELPCSEVDEAYQPVCYASAGSYRQYEPGSESFQTSYQFCAHVPHQYAPGCFAGVAERALIATAENQKKLNVLCRAMSDKDIKIVCINSVQLMKKSNAI